MTSRKWRFIQSGHIGKRNKEMQWSSKPTRNPSLGFLTWGLDLSNGPEVGMSWAASVHKCSPFCMEICMLSARYDISFFLFFYFILFLIFFNISFWETSSLSEWHEVFAFSFSQHGIPRRFNSLGCLVSLARSQIVGREYLFRISPHLAGWFQYVYLIKIIPNIQGISLS